MKGQWIPRSMECVECQDRDLLLPLKRKERGWFRQLQFCEKASSDEVIYSTNECSPSDLHQGGLLFISRPWAGLIVIQEFLGRFCCRGVCLHHPARQGLGGR